MMIDFEMLEELRAEWIAIALEDCQVDNPPTADEIKAMPTRWCPVKVPVEVIDRTMGADINAPDNLVEMAKFRWLETMAGDALINLGSAAGDGHVRSARIECDFPEKPRCRGEMLMPEAADLRVSEENRETIADIVFARLLMTYLLKFHLPAFGKLLKEAGYQQQVH